ncbi:hypothetical protein P152DRAFT_465827 [Eremomyces bilateralis CBS 781.70]|uniref:F-box domain-containing protein n=1 Tax=Eremomyces bilateralis CBS 781.70 TaxID=1392243 RepID=A0A6G1G508_9PEZI|nr:uncharacterized protein P152DRAFT_465827 [Eremomyces bilateralis CBS 781.70]KAF1813134.1 hypothetical protein P152DRAFT_465827 [Eremomyces bilateralis CBS 781.70]
MLSPVVDFLGLFDLSLFNFLSTKMDTGPQLDPMLRRIPIIECDVNVCCPLYTLPNELLHHILMLLPTMRLLPLYRISNRFHSLVARILHLRLLSAARLHNHTLLFECYHPSAKLTEPQLFCSYQGTIGLDVALELEGEEHGNPYLADIAESGYPLHSFANFHKLYSSFRPHLQGPDADTPARWSRHQAGDIPGSRTYYDAPGTAGSDPEQENTSVSSAEDQAISHTIFLDSHELFTQLCAAINLVKVGPRKSLFLSFVEVSEGVIRVWRDWLSTMSSGSFNSGIQILNDRKRRDSSGSRKSVETAETRFNSICQALQGDKRMLWVDNDMNVGIRVSVCERHLRQQHQLPILMGVNEVPVSYDIAFEEILIRTSHLLQTVEKSNMLQENQAKNAVIFGSFG